MGNVQSFHDASGKKIPKHLRPTRVSRSLRKRIISERKKRDDAQNKPKQERKVDVRASPRRRSTYNSTSSEDQYDGLVSLEIKSNYKYMKGRRFHDIKTVRYLLPNDTHELERQQLDNYLLKWAFGKNYSAPIDDVLTAGGAKVLDVGCGPATWLLDMASDLPKTNFIGIDMSDVFPKSPFNNLDEEEEDPYDLTELDSEDGEESLSSGASFGVAPEFNGPRFPENLSFGGPSSVSKSTSDNRVGNTTTIATSTTATDSMQPSPTSPTTDSHKFNSPSLVDSSARPANSNQAVNSNQATKTSKSRVSKMSKASKSRRSPKLRIDDRNLRALEHRGKSTFVPPNVSFEVKNMLEGLAYENGTFDFVHQRDCAFAYTRLQWIKVIDEMVRVTKPGGYVQVSEMDISPQKMGPKTTIMFQKLLFAVRARDVEPEIACCLQDALRAAGLVNVQKKFVSVPFGEWGLEIGRLWMDSIRMLAASCKPWLTKSFGVRGKDYDKSWDDVFKEMEEHKTFTNWVVAWGQRPEDGELTKDWEHCGLSSDRFSYLAFSRIGKYGYTEDGNDEDGEFELKENDPWGFDEEEDSGLDSELSSFRNSRARGYKSATDTNPEGTFQDSERPMRPKFPKKIRTPRHKSKSAQLPKFPEGTVGVPTYQSMASDADSHVVNLPDDDITSIDSGKVVLPKFYWDSELKSESKLMPSAATTAEVEKDLGCEVSAVAEENGEPSVVRVETKTKDKI